MNEQYNEIQSKIPLYFSGQMTGTEREDFEALLDVYPELRAEVEALRVVYEDLDRTFSAASDTRFKLSPARRAALRQQTDANVVRLTDVEPKRAGAALRRIGKKAQRTIRWVSVAASFIVGGYLGLMVGQQQYHGNQGTPPIVAEVDVIGTQIEYAAVLNPYPKAYGLDKPENVQLAKRAPEEKAGFASLNTSATQPVESTAPYDAEFGSSSPMFLGLDGPRPFDRLSIGLEPGVI